MRAKVDEAGVGGKVAAHEVARGLRYEDLAAVARGRDPGRAVDVDANVAHLPAYRFPRMEAHPITDGHSVRPGPGGQRPLPRDRAGEARPCGREGVKEPVP